MRRAGFDPVGDPVADRGAGRADDERDQRGDERDLGGAPTVPAAARRAIDAGGTGRGDHPPGAIFGGALVADPHLVQRVAQRPLAIAHRGTSSSASARWSRPRRSRELTVPRGSSSIRAISPGVYSSR